MTSYSFCFVHVVCLGRTGHVSRKVRVGVKRGMLSHVQSGFGPFYSLTLGQGKTSGQKTMRLWFICTRILRLENSHKLKW